MRRIYALVFLFFILFSCGVYKPPKTLNKELRIVSLAPSNTEILKGLSLSDKIVGCDQYSKQVLGESSNSKEFKFGDVNIEEIINLNPNILFLAHDSVDESKYNKLKEFGIDIVNIKTPTSIEEIYNSINLIGKKTSKESESLKMVEGLKSEINKIKGTTKGARVYFEIGKPPYIYSFGNGTFLNDIIENVLGSYNILSKISGWFSPSEEFIIKSDPEVIFTSVNLKDTVDEIKNRKGWGNILAIKNNRVYYIDENASSRASQNFIKAVYEMKRCLDE